MAGAALPLAFFPLGRFAFGHFLTGLESQWLLPPAIMPCLRPSLYATPGYVTRLLIKHNCNPSLMYHREELVWHECTKVKRYGFIPCIYKCLN